MALKINFDEATLVSRVEVGRNISNQFMSVEGFIASLGPDQLARKKTYYIRCAV